MKAPEPADDGGRERREKAVKDLTSSMRGRSLWNRIFGVDPIEGRMEGGVRVLTYSFESHSHHDWSGTAEQIAEMQPDQREAVRRALHEIEMVANVRFDELSSSQNPEKADIRYFRASPGKNVNFWTGITKMSAPRDVLINKHPGPKSFEAGGDYNDTILHETCHALGLSHPAANGGFGGSGGTNAAYTRADTVMSYNHGASGDSDKHKWVNTSVGLGPFDIAALQVIYGQAKESAQRPTVIKAADLPGISTLWRSDGAAFTLDLTDGSGELSIDRSATGVADQIFGTINNKNVVVRLAPGMTIGEVKVWPNPGISVIMTGSPRLPDILKGGEGNDTLTPMGGGDTVRSGGGLDTLVLKPGSGRNNIVEDFDPAKDQVRIEGAKRAELRPADAGSTEVRVKDDAGKVIASAILRSEQWSSRDQAFVPVLPDRVKEQLQHLNKDVHVTVEGSTHPSGRPDSLPGGNNPHARGR